MISQASVTHRARFLLILLPLLWATGCAIGPTEPARQYLLPSAAQPPVAGVALPRVELELAGYLDQSGIVLQSSPTTVTTARRHRWADPLPNQLRRALLYHLSRDGAPGDGQLMVTVVQFQGSNDGHALVAGHWRYRGPSGERSGRFEESRPLEQDGYAALVAQLDKAWAAVAKQISSRLQP